MSEIEIYLLYSRERSLTKATNLRFNHKLERAKFALKNNRKMASFMATDLDCMEECWKWIQHVANNEEDIAALSKQIGELREVLLKENS